jgi:hypothetical protein
MKISHNAIYYVLGIILLILAWGLIGSKGSRHNETLLDAAAAELNRPLISGLKPFNSQRARVASYDQANQVNVDSSVRSRILEQPFTVNGLSPIAVTSLGFSPETVDHINKQIIETRLKIAQLFVDNMKLVTSDSETENSLAHYQYQANLDDGLKIKDELINKINTITAGSFDKEIEQLLGGSNSFLYCGTINFDFKIRAAEASSGGNARIIITGQTTDGHIVVPSYECDLSSFTRSTLIEFDISK